MTKYFSAAPAAFQQIRCPDVPSSKGAGNPFFNLNLLKNDERASNYHADLREIPFKSKNHPLSSSS